MIKFSSNKNVEPEPDVVIHVYNPALGRLREENFELDISPDFTSRHYLKEEKKPYNFASTQLFRKIRDTERQHELSYHGATQAPLFFTPLIENRDSYLIK